MPGTRWNFEEELLRHGPDSAGDRPVSPAEAHVYCARLARAHSENFTVASLLLPRHLLRHFHAVYAYCRWADDLADETGGGERAIDLIAWWREELLACYGAHLTSPAAVLTSPREGVA